MNSATAHTSCQIPLKFRWGKSEKEWGWLKGENSPVWPKGGRWDKGAKWGGGGAQRGHGTFSLATNSGVCQQTAQWPGSGAASVTSRRGGRLVCRGGRLLGRGARRLRKQPKGLLCNTTRFLWVSKSPALRWTVNNTRLPFPKLFEQGEIGWR